MKKCKFNFKTTYTNLPGQLFVKSKPASVPFPKVVILNNDLAASLGLDFSDFTDSEKAGIFSGNLIAPSSIPFSQSYAGHQFGNFTLLGDGRAHILGEYIAQDGKRFDIQLKGSGRTPFSRSGDGKAALGPMLREYLISEAMYNLGVPTTRSLAVVATGENIERETSLPGAILTRVSSSHIRCGTFEFANFKKDKNISEKLMNYTIERHYPDLLDCENKALSLLQAVMMRQIDLVVNWMRIGFIHGVMNTDNMAISGETIDYGPCAFMNNYDPNTVFSSIDYHGRYSYTNQPKITHWNIVRFAESLLPLIDNDLAIAINLAERIVDQFPSIYQAKWLDMMKSKLGLDSYDSGDEELIYDLLNWMYVNKLDYTNTFRDLSKENKPEGDIYNCKDFDEFYQKYRKRSSKNTISKQSSILLMKSSNPVVIPRNHLVEDALAAASEGELKLYLNLLDAVKDPYKDKEGLEYFKYYSGDDDQYKTFCGT
ncbi:MAG: YdiU family protein [Pseudomonadota bacterium]|nr:YdiU family protein [Pseudomonadota bacterium]